MRWLVTGGAGFIGSHLAAELLSLHQEVVILDNLSSGAEANLAAVQKKVDPEAWQHLTLLKGDIRDAATCAQAMEGVDAILHQAAIASVPASMKDPRTTHDVNVTGTLNLLTSALNAGVTRFVYASSSAVYGSDARSTKIETQTGRILSPYAASKAIDEVYAQTFAEAYQMTTVGLRYFNVFGPRQDPSGPYAAVIPLWIQSTLEGKPIVINGDGLNTRDFIPVRNVVQANLLAATAPPLQIAGRAFNVGLGSGTDLNTLASLIRSMITERLARSVPPEPVHQDFRPGDIRHSTADISEARRLLEFDPYVTFEEGLKETVDWFVEQATPSPSPSPSA